MLPYPTPHTVQRQPYKRIQLAAVGDNSHLARVDRLARHSLRDKVLVRRFNSMIGHDGKEYLNILLPYIVCDPGLAGEALEFG